MPSQGQFQAAELRNHTLKWQEITQDQISLKAIRGVKIPLISTPPLRCATKEELARKRVDVVIDKEVDELLQLGAIQVVPNNSMVFLSNVFTVAKTERGKEYGRRFILNLKVSIQNCHSG